MSGFPKENRHGSRRVLADRRSATPSRSGIERRVRQRREFALPVEVDRRGPGDRRSGERRGEERRHGVARRLGDRRTDTGTARVLVVAGEEALRSGLRRVLSRAGHEVVEAPEGHAGLSYSGETPADAVVVNLTLPDMDGVEFIRQLCRSCPDAGVVAFASRRPYGAPDPLAIATQLGAVRGLRWPFAPDRVVAAVDEVLGRRN